MSHNTYTDSHSFRGAFVANILGRLADLIVAQGEDLLQDAGLDFPARAVSSVLLIGERGQISASDIANDLGQPHQLVTQRVELLIKLQIIERLHDPNDARRKILTLTDKGAAQFKRLKACLADADRAFEIMFTEINCDLPTIAARAMEALDKSAIRERVKTLQTKDTALLHTQ